MSTIRQNYLQALVSAIIEEMRRDPAVFAMGEDMRSGIYGAYPLEEFGNRIRSLPISETANAGAAIGAALTGMRPVLDITHSTFLYSAMDQIVSQAAKSRLMFGGQASVPLVIRAALFYGGSQAAHHNDRPYAMFMHMPGLKIIAPSTPVNAKGLLKAAIRDDDPVLCFEDANLWGSRAEVPTDTEFVIPLGRAEVRREGSDVTIVGIAAGVRTAEQAAADLDELGISAEVIDPRSLVPFDWPTVLASVEKTRRLVVVDPAPRTCGAAAEIAMTVAEHLHEMLLAPTRRVTGLDVHLPFSPPLERAALPDRHRVVDAVQQSLRLRPSSV
jgi:acetoin:2,6-dichlorophenolindophenol oxidoreductase subunit beta